MQKKHIIYFFMALFLPFMMIAGCVTSEKSAKETPPVNPLSKKLPWTKKEEAAMNTLPSIKNEELGIELPPNVHTDWKIREQNGERFILFYQDPHKKGNPPYRAGKSPDVESLFFIQDYAEKESGDPLTGFWVTQIGIRISDKTLIPIGKVEYGEDHFFSAIHIWKNQTDNHYEASLINYTIKSAAESKVDAWKQQGLKPLDVLLSRECTQEQKFDYQSEVQVNRDITTIRFLKGTKEEALLKCKYQEEYNTLEILSIEISDDNKKKIFYNFGNNDRNDILKKYTTSNSFHEFLSAFLQLKMDTFRSSHGGDIGYQNIMLNFPHRKVIK